MSPTSDAVDSEWPVQRRFIPAFLGRLFLIVYAKLHDYLFHVRFTDIDYIVFTDAARYVSQGLSPFQRSTYRYSPFLAWLLVPNVYFWDFGKIGFCLVDMLVGWLLYKINTIESKKSDDFISALSIFWLFNPFTAIISARGNGDGLVCAAVLLSLWLLKKKHWLLAALAHGALAIHLKLYPVIFLPSVFLHLANATSDLSFGTWIGRCFKNGKGFIYCALSILAFLILLGLGFILYGELFLNEYLLYHFHRVDVKHNFSSYFLPLYLARDDVFWIKVIGFGAFIPQVFCILLFAIRYSHDLPFCWFLTTFTFVALNKVCTSQYFIWYICLLPLIVDRIEMCSMKALSLTFLWFVGQGIWLIPAYLLEFQGYNCFEFIWLASILFMGINFYIIRQILLSYSNRSQKKLN